MSQAVQPIRTNPAAELRQQLVKMSPEFENALPAHIKPEKFQRVVMTVVQQTPDLLRADRQTLLAACLKCAADGLIPDGREAALVLFGGKVQYMPMFTGIQKRVRNSGEIASIQAHVIYEHDKFKIVRGLSETIEHEPLFPGDRGKPIGAYSIAKFKDGSDPMFEVMDINAIEKVRKVSRASGNGPWVQWWDEMARKTVFRRLAKWLPMDAEVDDVVRRDDEAGVPTIEGPAVIAEPSGMMIEQDGFELASAGVVVEQPVVGSSTAATAATAEADALIAKARTHDTDAAVLAWRMSAKTKAALGELQTSAPAEFQRVEQDIADWRAKLNAGAA